MAVNMTAGFARLGLATFGITVAFATMCQPSAAQDGGKPAGAPALDKGKDLFANYACGSCHSLDDAGAAGHVGPALDGNPNLTEAFVVNRVTNGQGGMPAFKDQLSQEEIAALAAYVMHAASK